ncbi:hypothetical protein SNE40_005103 [Patella caerulea]|uniref:Uncharacterized protein n=1 Tax=Patella caerulea TaxID=87958 RepID=A0AAN8QDB9_PATCE
MDKILTAIRDAITKNNNSKTELVIDLFNMCNTNDTVVNLSDTPLNQTEIDLLSKGPTPKDTNIGLIYQDLKAFFRRLRLAHFFGTENEPYSKNSLN